MWWNAFSIFLLVSFATVIHAQAKWDPLHLFVVCKRGLLKPADQDRLQGAMKWFEQAVQVERTVLEAELISKMKKKIPPYTGLLTITAPDKVFSIAHDSPELDKLWEYATPIFLDYDAAVCVETVILAAASPIYDGNNQRPFAIKMVYCPENTDAEVEVFDIFRHEVLHGLGYAGTFKPGAGTTETYDWVEEDGSTQPATRRFLKLEGDPVIEEIKKHFDCPDDKFGRAESDPGHRHLNKYIFGNEIMTPAVHARGIFSYISAEVLEKSFSGPKPWYKVNRTFIAAEAETYTYGKGLGCDFLSKSCWELFKAKDGTTKFMYPFCRGTMFDNQQKTMCFYHKSTPTQFQPVNCKKTHHPSVPAAKPGDKATDGMVLKPNANPNHPDHFRFCPLAWSDYGSMETMMCPPGF